MTDEEAMQAAIDANPEDMTLKMAFADFLDERNDPRAAGYRWMGQNGKRAINWWTANQFLRQVAPRGAHIWGFHDGIGRISINEIAPEYCTLPQELLRETIELKAEGMLEYSSCWTLGLTRRNVEDAVALAYATWSLSTTEQTSSAPTECTPEPSSKPRAARRSKTGRKPSGRPRKVS
jgi:uncharacterized protein (TIGR02996 family)